jgi:hypothetical protein
MPQPQLWSLTMTDNAHYQLFITLTTNDEHIELAALKCRREDYDELSGIHEGDDAPSLVMIDLIENDNLSEDTIIVSVPTALAVLPDVITRILREQLTTNAHASEDAA